MMSYLTLGGPNNDEADFMGTAGGKGGLVGMAGNSNLSSLFGLNDQLNNNPSSNQSLTYTAPKPPGKSTEASQKQASASGAGVAIAVAVTAYRYVNGQNVKQGRLGAALLKNAAAKDYKILMYVTKQQPVSTAQISPSFHFTVQPNNYASFTDDQKQTWTVLFESTQQLHNFAKQVCLAKFFSNSEASASNTVQDLAQGENQSNPVETGNSLEMKYTGWLVSADGALGAVFDSNHNTEKTFRFKTGRGKVIKGWESGMLGMRKGGKRFLVIPPALAYGQRSVGNKIPPNSILSFEVDLLRIKQGKDSSSVKSSESVESLPQAVASEVPSPPNTGLLSADNTLTVPTDAGQSEIVKGRTASLTEQISHNLSADGTKASLVNRMARMGHAMLPVAHADNQAVNPQLEQQQQINTMHPHSSTPPLMQPPAAASPIPYTQTQLPSQPTQLPQQIIQVQPVQSGQILSQPMQSSHIQSQPIQQHPYQGSPLHHLQQRPPVMSSQMQAMQQSFPATQGYLDQSMMSQPFTPSSDPSAAYNNFPGYRQMSHFPRDYGNELMPVLISESRQQSSELRLLQEKVDKVSGLVEEVRKNTTDSTSIPSKQSSSQSMDPAVIMHNVQRIMEENEQLKKKVEEKNEQIQQQNDKISDLLQQSQKHVEKSNMMLEQRNDSFKESFNQSQARSLQLEQDKVDLTQRLSDATARTSELMLEVTNAKQRETELKQKFKEIYIKEKERAEEAEEKVKDLEEEMSSLNDNLNASNSTEEQLKTKLNELQGQVTNLSDKSELQNKDYSEKLLKAKAENEELERKLKQTEASHLAQIAVLSSDTALVNTKSKEQTEMLNALQEELARSKEKLDEMTGKHEESEKKVSAIQQRFRSAYEEQNSKLQEALSDAEDAKAYKEGYERLRSQAAIMKEKYEARIRELSENLEDASKSSGETPQVVDEVKKIMNSIFQQVRAKIETEEEYKGAEVLKIIVEIIKSTTLSLLSGSTKRQEDDEEDESGAEDTDGDVEEEEEEESDKDTDEEKVTVPKDEEKSLEQSQHEDDPQGPEEKAADGVAKVDGVEEVSEEKADSSKKDNTLENTSETIKDPQKPFMIKESSQEGDLEQKRDESDDKAKETSQGSPLESSQNVPENDAEPEEGQVASVEVEKDAERDPESEKKFDLHDQSPEDKVTESPDDQAENVDDNQQPSNVVVVEEETTASNEVTDEQQQQGNERAEEKTGQSESDAKPNQQVHTDQNKPSASTIRIENVNRSSEKESNRPEVKSTSQGTISDAYDRKPPPLFDDDSDDDDDLDWFK